MRHSITIMLSLGVAVCMKFRSLMKRPAIWIIAGCLLSISVGATEVFSQWTRSNTPAVMRRLVFADSLHGYFLSDQEVGFHCTDGGRDWTDVGQLLGSLSFDEFNISHSPHDGSATFTLRFAELRVNPDSVFRSEHVPQWYRTLGEIMYDSSYGFRMVQIIGGSGSLTDSLRILVTHDDWYTSGYYGSLISDPGFLSYTTYYPVNAARLIDSNEIWLAYGPHLLHTRNAFATWTSTLCIADTVKNHPVWGRIYAFPESHEIYAVSIWTLAHNDIAYVYSSDYGQTWRSDSSLGGNVMFGDVPNPNELWLMRGTYADGSKNSTLYHSTDKGFSWSADSVTFRADTITEMFWLNDRQGWIGGFAGHTGRLWHYGATNAVTQAEAPVDHQLFYPNPASNELKVVSESGNVQILDALGRVRSQVRITPGNKTIDLSALPVGVFEVILTERGSRSSSKLLITR